MNNPINPWKTISSKVAYRNPWFTVREDQVIRPDGNPGIYGVVETRIATGVVALSSKETVYLVGQYRYPLECYSWEIIEGGTDEGEDAEAAARRELREEAGLVAKNWQKLGGDVHLSNCISSELGVLFLARELTQTDSCPDGTEVLKIRECSIEQALTEVRTGLITDAMSIIALMRLDEWLREGSR